jgi:hypothetical protein
MDVERSVLFSPNAIGVGENERPLWISTHAVGVAAKQTLHAIYLGLSFGPMSLPKLGGLWLWQ